MTTICAECGVDTKINGIDLKDGRHTHYSAISCRDELKKQVEDYRKILWVLARREGLSLQIPKVDLATVPDGAELLQWDEPLFDAVMLKGICSPINQPDLAKPIHGAQGGANAD